MESNCLLICLIETNDDIISSHLTAQLCISIYHRKNLGSICWFDENCYVISFRDMNLKKENEIQFISLVSEKI